MHRSSVLLLVIVATFSFPFAAFAQEPDECSLKFTGSDRKLVKNPTSQYRVEPGL